MCFVNHSIDKVSDLWHAHQRGEETSMNPLGLIEALIGAISHAAVLEEKATGTSSKPLIDFVKLLRKALHNTFRFLLIYFNFYLI